MGVKILVESMKKFRKPHKCGKRFYNHEHEHFGGVILRSIKMIFQHRALCKKEPQQGESCWIEKSNPIACSIDPLITWMGHASFLVQVGGVNILLDPIFGDVSPLYRRILPVGIPSVQLPSIDFIVISHNHRDHMDSSSLLAVKKKFPDVIVLVPEGDKRWFDRRRFVQTYEHTWWSQRSFPLKNDSSKTITFTFLPAAHWSQRGLFDKNKSLWGSWMIECGRHKIYFAGDTCYSVHFGEIAQEFPIIDIALMPVGPHEPREWLEEWHLGSSDAGQSFLDLGAEHMIPMHWGTFPFGVEHFDIPIKRIQRWWEVNQDKLSGKRLHCAKVGQGIVFDGEVEAP